MLQTHTIYKALLFTACYTLLQVFTTAGQVNVSYNKTTGALSSISNPADKYGMNFIFASGDKYLTWQKPEQDWGLGQYNAPALGLKNEKWVTPSSFQQQGNAAHLTYHTRALNVTVTRKPDKQGLLETYSFKNTTGKTLTISGMNIFTPFNDNYPEAKIAATMRCNAHVWAGLNSSYVNAVRMNGHGPHLGLVFTRGAMKSYSINNVGDHPGVPFAYSASNVRGVITFDIEDFTLKPGETYTVQWKLFWHNGPADFYAKAKALGFVRLSAPSYTLNLHQKLNININAAPSAGIKNHTVQVACNTLGEHTKTITYAGGKKRTILNYYVISSPQQLITKRVNFIVDHQQLNNKADARDGAYLVYDNEADTIVTNADKTVSPADRDEGAERLGMGVLIAKWLQTHKDEKVYKSLLRYTDFVHNKLQDDKYFVYSTADHKSRRRGYNYPWVAHLYLETYKLTGDKKYLQYSYNTMSRYFKEFGYQHYSIDFRIKDGLHELKKAGMQAQYDTLYKAFTQVGDYFVKTGLAYPKHEVTYEQSIVAPAVSTLCEIYQVTNDKKYLDAAKIQLHSLESFGGTQPDPHLNDIGIRHWDGYWFGKREMYGDTMPHYWSALTAIAFQRYYQCTGEKQYLLRAQNIVRNNLLNINEEGRGSCAYLYPAYINGQKAKFYDAFANDQDWAPYFYLEVMSK